MNFNSCPYSYFSSLSSNVGSPDSTISISIKAGMDRIWEILNTGTWKDVPEYIKHIYTLMSYYRMVDLLTSVPICDWTLKFVEKCIHILDKGYFSFFIIH